MSFNSTNELDNVGKHEEDKIREEKYNKWQKELDELLQKKGMTREQVNDVVKEKGCYHCWNSFPWTSENVTKCFLNGCSGYSYYNGD